MNSSRKSLQKMQCYVSFTVFDIKGKNFEILTFFVVGGRGGTGITINLLESPGENKKDHMYDIPSA